MDFFNGYHFFFYFFFASLFFPPNSIKKFFIDFSLFSPYSNLQHARKKNSKLKFFH